MTDMQYESLCRALRAVAARTSELDSLNDGDLQALTGLLIDATDAAGRTWQARGAAYRDQRIAQLEAENARLRHEANNQAHTASLIEQIITRADAAEMRAARAEAEIQAARALFDYIYKRSDTQTAEEAQLIDAYAQSREAAE